MRFKCLSILLVNIRVSILSRGHTFGPQRKERTIGILRWLHVYLYAFRCKRIRMTVRHFVQKKMILLLLLRLQNPRRYFKLFTDREKKRFL